MKLEHINEINKQLKENKNYRSDISHHGSQNNPKNYFL